MNEKRCGTCKCRWQIGEEYDWMCMNEQSDFFCDWTDEDFVCEKWEANDSHE